MAADLAVDLDGVLDGVGGQIALVSLRERAVRQRRVVAESAPQFLGQVRGQRGGHQHQRLQRRAGDHAGSGQVVGVLDQFGRGGVVAQARVVVADAGDGAV